jgi:hypothetical protein
MRAERYKMGSAAYIGPKCIVVGSLKNPGVLDFAADTSSSPRPFAELAATFASQRRRLHP